MSKAISIRCKPRLARLGIFRLSFWLEDTLPLTEAMQISAMRFILLGFCLYIFMPAHAQDYISLLGENKRWDIGYFDGEGCPVPTPSFVCDISAVEYQYEVEIDDVIYQYYEHAPGPFVGSAYLREDVVEKKVYWYDNGEERLLYDFDLVIGDTIIVFDLNSQASELIILEVDTVILEDDVPRRGYNFQGNWVDYWIEGIGNIYNGLFYHTEGLGIGTLLICYTEDGLEL
jgi:hypothetical protein